MGFSAFISQLDICVLAIVYRLDFRQVDIQNEYMKLQT